MELRLLAIGDVVGENGVAFLADHLAAVQKLHGVHFTVANGENVSGVGLTPKQAKDLYATGVDAITLGNHTWNRLQITNIIDDVPWLLRPANYSRRVPGKGFGIFSGPQGLRIGVLNLIGRTAIDPNVDNPFTVADGILRANPADLWVVDFHAEATSEKGAMGYYLDGRVQAVWGTHTHVPTADCQVLPKGTGFVTDLGMTGPLASVLGIRPEQAINRFLGGLPARFEPAQGPCGMNAALFTIDTAAKACVGVERVDIADR